MGERRGSPEARPEGAGGAWSAARDYDDWFEHGWGAYAFGVEADAVTRAFPGGGIDAVDVGCGTGRFTRLLEARGARVVGVDREPAMLTVARERLRGPLVVADASALPFRDEAVDLALAVTVLEFVPDPARVLDELARVTRRGGRVVVGALNPASPWGWAHRRLFSQPPWSGARFLRRRELRDLARRYGPADVHAALSAPGWFPGLGALGPALEALGGAVPVLGAFQVLVIHRR